MSPRAQRILNEGVLRAMQVCLEGMPADAIDLLGRNEVRRLLQLYVHEFAHVHGVILNDEDILDCLDEHVRTRRSTTEITPITTPIGDMSPVTQREDTHQ